MDNSLEVLNYHDCIHGYLAGRGLGLATTNMKLAQHLAYIKWMPLYRGLYTHPEGIRFD